VEGVQSVSALAGYEVLTEGRGSNAGTCLINLKDWSKRKHSAKEIVEELEEKPRLYPALLSNSSNHRLYRVMALRAVSHCGCSIRPTTEPTKASVRSMMNSWPN
jgi:hypothetical protein